MDCAASIISLKDEIHQQWFNLQSYPNKIKILNETLLQKDLAYSILKLGRMAEQKAYQCPAAAEQTSALTNILNRFESKLGQAKQTNYLGNIYYSMPKDVATEIIITDINKLANIVHLIGSSFIVTTGEHGGCKTGISTSLKEVNSAALAYCEGISREQGFLREEGTLIEHRLGVHSVVIKTKESEDGYDIHMKYDESGQSNWKARQAGVVNVIEDTFGLKCDVKSISAQCSGKINRLDDIREMAYFLSGVHDIDLLDENCISDAVNLAKKQAKDTIKEFGEAAYTQYAYPYMDYEWNKDVCGEPEKEAPNIKILIDRLSSLTESMSKTRQLVRESNCSNHIYGDLMYVGELETQFWGVCEALAEQDTGQGGQCSEKYVKEEHKNTDSVIELAKRCPPIPVISEVKKGDFPLFFLDPIKAFCQRISDQKCLEAVAKAFLPEEPKLVPPEKLKEKYVSMKEVAYTKKHDLEKYVSGKDVLAPMQDLLSAVENCDQKFSYKEVATMMKAIGLEAKGPKIKMCEELIKKKAI